MDILGQSWRSSLTFSRSATQTAALVQLRSLLNDQLKGIEDAGTFKSERVITSSQSTRIQVAGGSQKILNFCANNYLGLAVNKNFQ